MRQSSRAAPLTSPLFGWQVLLMRNRSMQPMMNKEQTVTAVRKDTELSSWTCFSFPGSINVQNGREC